MTVSTRSPSLFSASAELLRHTHTCIRRHITQNWGRDSGGAFACIIPAVAAVAAAAGGAGNKWSLIYCLILPVRIGRFSVSFDADALAAGVDSFGRVVVIIVGVHHLLSR